MSKALFLDRDGIINVDNPGYTYRIEEFKFQEGIFELCRSALEKKYLLIIISNQGGIAKGIYSHRDVEVLHKYMLKELRKQKINITDIYYCPHHPDFSGKCLCRKPDTLMLEKAIAKYKIDISKSFFVGNMDNDVSAGNKIGIKTILYPTIFSVTHTPQATYIIENLYQAMKIIWTLNFKP